MIFCVFALLIGKVAIVFKKKIFFSWLAFWILLWAYAYWSWIPTAPNTFLFNQSLFVDWQMFLWSGLTTNHFLITSTYTIIIIGLFIAFYSFYQAIKKAQLQWSGRFFISLLLITSLPLLLSFNVLSFDVFNYAFNAKAVWLYGANPHIQVAQDFPDDPWLKFMHNVHTGAPYGYLWTLISLGFYLLASGKLAVMWIFFRFGNLLILLSIYYLLLTLAKKIKRPLNTHQLVALFFNPLVLLELIANHHNDWWMMSLSLLALTFVFSKQCFLVKVLTSLLAMITSISIKFATIVLLPLLIWQWGRDFFANKLRILAKIINANFFTFCSLLLFVPLLTARSQYFHPWYLTWSLVFYPLIEQRSWRVFLILISFTSLLRYLPFLHIMGYGTETLWQQQLITWCLPLLYLLLILFKYGYHQFACKK